jgi:hypothetical protein
LLSVLRPPRHHCLVTATAVIVAAIIANAFAIAAAIAVAVIANAYAIAMPSPSSALS